MTNLSLYNRYKKVNLYGKKRFIGLLNCDDIYKKCE